MLVSLLSSSSSQKLFLVMTEQTLEYDMDENQKLQPTRADYANKDDPLVQEKMGYVYNCAAAPPAHTVPPCPAPLEP